MIFRRRAEVREQKIVDIHSHVLPGLDDGAKNLSESLSMLRLAVSEGISDMIVTPHFHTGRFAAAPGKIRQKLQLVQDAADRERIPVRLYLGSEIYYFDEILSALWEERLCTMNGTHCVLLEFSPSVLFQTVQNAMDRVIGEGYQPVLAHAERYACLLKNADDAVFLRSMGVQLQVNASSVTGKNGLEAKRFVHRLMKYEAVDYIGTDAHGSVHRTPEIARCREMVERKYGRDYAYQVMRGNAVRMFGL